MAADKRQLALDFLAAKRLATEARAAQKKVEAELIAVLDAEKLDRYEVTDDDGVATPLTVRKDHRIVRHEDKLRAKLSDYLWRKVTRRRLDPELLEAAVKMGSIEQRLVDRCQDVTPKTPYVQVGKPKQPAKAA